jgi:hypothetical protein
LPRRERPEFTFDGKKFRRAVSLVFEEKKERSAMQTEARATADGFRGNWLIIVEDDRTPNDPPVIGRAPADRVGQNDTP